VRHQHIGRVQPVAWALGSRRTAALRRTLDHLAANQPKQWR
jgi:hypothetical protein